MTMSVTVLKGRPMGINEVEASQPTGVGVACIEKMTLELNLK